MQGGEGAGLAEGDAKAVILMKEMETGDWGETRLTEADRVGEGVHVGNETTTPTEKPHRRQVDRCPLKEKH